MTRETRTASLPRAARPSPWPLTLRIWRWVGVLVVASWCAPSHPRVATAFAVVALVAILRLQQRLDEVIEGAGGHAR